MWPRLTKPCPCFKHNTWQALNKEHMLKQYLAPLGWITATIVTTLLGIIRPISQGKKEVVRIHLAKEMRFLRF